jgi:hypothetical protein
MDSRIAQRRGRGSGEYILAGASPPDSVAREMHSKPSRRIEAIFAHPAATGRRGGDVQICGNGTTGGLFAKRLAEVVQGNAEVPGADVVVPVPLHSNSA